MAKSINQVILMGNLTRDPELRQTPSGQNVCNFGIALNRSYKGQDGEWQEATDFVNCVAWGPLGERVSQYLKRGSRAMVQGSLRSSSWEQDGQKRSKLEVWANDVTFLDGRGSGGDGSSSAGSTSYGSPSDDSGSTSDTAKATKKKKDEASDEIGDEPINLDEIPF